MCCLLFCCAECLRGETLTAAIQIQNGIHLLLEWREKHSSTFGDSDVIERHIAPILQRLDSHVVALSFLKYPGQKTFEYVHFGPDNPVPDQFDSIEHARQVLLPLIRQSVELTRDATFQRYDGGVAPELHELLLKCKIQTLRWESALVQLIESLPDPKAAYMLRRVLALRLHIIILKVGVQTAADPKQCSSDLFFDDFERVIEMAELVSRHDSSISDPALDIFSFEEGTGPAGYYVAAKCRHPKIRRRAIEVMRQSPCRQGVWNTPLLIAVAERVIEIEESGMDAGDEVPREEARVHLTDIEQKVDGEPRTHLVSFYTRPDGVTAEWKIWKEAFVL